MKKSHILFDNKMDDQGGQADNQQETKGIDKQQLVPDGKILDQTKRAHTISLNETDSRISERIFQKVPALSIVNGSKKLLDICSTV